MEKTIQQIENKKQFKKTSPTVEHFRNKEN